MGISKLFAWIMHVRHVNLNIVCVSGLLLKHTAVLQWFQRANGELVKYVASHASQCVAYCER